jgi:hypothetical protein
MEIRAGDHSGDDQSKNQRRDPEHESLIFVRRGNKCFGERTIKFYQPHGQVGTNRPPSM